jgi:hypothetical protein
MPTTLRVDLPESASLAWHSCCAYWPSWKSRYIGRVLQSPLPEETPIWRYMDLQRFVTILVSGALRFTKAAEFGDDPWEGFCKVIIPSTAIPEKLEDGTVHLQSVEQLLASFARHDAKYLDNARQHLYVNSWSMCADSMAMWKIYGANGKGLAILSSVGRCTNALSLDLTPDHYRFGCVQYDGDILNSPKILVDFSRSSPLPGPELRKQVTSKGFLKRSCYLFEEEWRGALYQEVRPNDTGVDIPCVLDTLIEAVVVGPNSDLFLVGVIEDLMGKFGIEKAVSRSTLLQAPPDGRIFTLEELKANQACK